MIAFIVLVNTEIDELSTVHEALKGEQSDWWKEAMKSKYSSLIKNDTWELVPGMSLSAGCRRNSPAEKGAIAG